MDYIDQNKKMYDMKFSEGWGSYYPSSEIITLYHRYIKNRMPKDKKLRVLDFGCGRGANLEFFSDMGFEVYGIDISKEAIDICKNNQYFKADHFIQCDVIKDKSLQELFDIKFDVIVATVSLTYLGKSDIKNVIKQFSQCLNQGGVVISSFFEKQVAFEGERNEEGLIYSKISNLDINHYTFILESKDELRELFSEFKEIALGEVKSIFPEYNMTYTYYIGEFRN